MPFVPPSCPRAECAASQPSHPFRYRRRGTYRRRCDGRSVPRFLCLTCRRSFSVQTFRVDYRWKKPALDALLVKDFVSKVTLRQSARTLGVTRATVERRLDRYGLHARRFHEARMEGKELAGTFQLDEGESFEENRREKPLTLPVLIERSSRFLVHVEVASLPSRPSAGGSKRRGAPSSSSSSRRSGSRAAVKRCFETLARHRSSTTRPFVQTDRKTTYPSILREVFGKDVLHERTISTRKRDVTNPLFAVNHTLAMLRDGLSRLVRRNWAHAKRAVRLERALWVYLLWRNYVRSVTNERRDESPAMAAGVETEPWTTRGIVGFSAEFPSLLEAH